MNKQILKSRIKNIEEKIQNASLNKKTPSVSKKRYLPHTEEFRRRIKNAMPFLKKAVLTSAIGLAVFLPVGQAGPSASANVLQRAELIDIAEKLRDEKIGEIVKVKAQNLQNQIINKTDSLQKLIRSAPPKQKDKIISQMFDRVYKNCGLNGKFNYCVAGAMFVRLNCQDDVLNKLLPDPVKKQKDYYPKMGNHPNVTCTTLKQFFKDRYGENYADRQTQNFSQFLCSIEAGDILTISSRQNSSTGMHCVTCAGPLKNGKLPVKGFNGEKNYEISVSQVTYAVKVMKQYREELTRQLQAELGAEKFMPVMNGMQNSLYFSNSTSEDSIPLPKDRLKGNTDHADLAQNQESNTKVKTADHQVTSTLVVFKNKNLQNG